MFKKTAPEYATFWQRLLAFLFDVFIIVFPAFMIVMEFAAQTLFDVRSLESENSDKFELIYTMHKNMIFILLAGCGISALVSSLCTISRWQASPGKRIVGIYVANRDGSKAKFANLIGRCMSLPLFIFTIQIFERNQAYEQLDKLKASGKVIKDVSEIQPYLASEYSYITSLVVFSLIAFWFLRIFFSPEKAAFHDTLFNTRVFQGKK